LSLAVSSLDCSVVSVSTFVLIVIHFAVVWRRGLHAIILPDAACGRLQNDEAHERRGPARLQNDSVASPLRDDRLERAEDRFSILDSGDLIRLA